MICDFVGGGIVADVVENADHIASPLKIFVNLLQ